MTPQEKKEQAVVPPEPKAVEPAAAPHEKAERHRSRRAIREVERRRSSRVEEARRRAYYDEEVRRSYAPQQRGLLFTDVWPQGSWHQDDRR